MIKSNWFVKNLIMFIGLIFIQICQRTISTQKLKLLCKVPRYDFYYSLTPPLKWKLFELGTCTVSHYLVLNFYQINGDGEIWTHDRLIIKALIPCQRTISTQKLKLLGKVRKYDLYYSLTNWFLKNLIMFIILIFIQICLIMI
jgi:hypothetical protein